MEIDITSDGVEDNQIGWRHFTVVDYVRGCDVRRAGDCVQFWVDSSKTVTESISVVWTLADQNGTSFLGEQQVTVSNEEHPTQTGVIEASSVTYSLNPADKNFTASLNMAPGVKYVIELRYVSVIKVV